MSRTNRDSVPVFKPKVYVSPAAQRQLARSEIEEGLDEWEMVRRGSVPDLGPTVFASGWERDFARFLNLLTAWKVIEDWEYEPQTFTFQGLGYKRGPFTYRPDFVVRYKGRIRKDVRELLEEIFEEVKPGETVYIEVKGQETGNDRSKWRRFRKHVTDNLEVVKRDKMMKIQAGFAPVIPNWESSIR